MKLYHLAPVLLAVSVCLWSGKSVAASGSEEGSSAVASSSPEEVQAPQDNRLPPAKPPILKPSDNDGSDDDGGRISTGGDDDGGKVIKPKKPGKKGKISKKTKKKSKKKKAAPAEYPYALGAKFGLMPYSAMSATSKAGGADFDYDMSMSYGLGLDGHILLAPGFYVTGEAMYWWTEIQEVDGKDYGANSGDAVIDLGIGVKWVFLGSQATSDRVYARGYLGFTWYSSSDDNAVDADRTGLYYGAGVGIQHVLSKPISLFAEGGLMFHSFTSTGSGEKDALLWNLQAVAGFQYHWE